MPVAVAELLPIMIPPWKKPVTVAVDRLVATGIDDNRMFELDLSSCPLALDEPVATSLTWHLPVASKAPDPAIVLMKLAVARTDGLVVVGHVTSVFASTGYRPAGE